MTLDELMRQLRERCEREVVHEGGQAALSQRQWAQHVLTLLDALTAAQKDKARLQALEAHAANALVRVNQANDEAARLREQANAIMALIGIESDEHAQEAVERTKRAWDARVSALQGELAEAQTRGDEWHAGYHDIDRALAEEQAESARLRAERDAAREALREAFRAGFLASPADGGWAFTPEESIAADREESAWQAWAALGQSPEPQREESTDEPQL